MPDQISFDFLMTQGVLGFTTALSLWFASRLWQRLETEREQHAEDVKAKEKEFDLKLAEWQKLYTASIEQRITETNLHASRVADANAIVRDLHFNRGPRLEQAS
jgi:response regulator RpfG family c-di-GMP phosphodiesterase